MLARGYVQTLHGEVEAATDTLDQAIFLAQQAGPRHDDQGRHVARHPTGVRGARGEDRAVEARVGAVQSRRGTGVMEPRVLPAHDVGG